jgi:hypothetical protein
LLPWMLPRQIDNIEYACDCATPFVLATPRTAPTLWNFSRHSGSGERPSHCQRFDAPVRGLRQ